jgi:ABC-2 type transport system permease protein
MTTPSNLGPDPGVDSPPAAPAVLRATRPLYWSVRRELWENKSIYVAPLAAAAVLLFGFAISTITLPRRMQAVMALDPAQQSATVTMPFNVIAGLVFVTAFIVAVFYCLDALHGERRDRSILFWKSLPVSDLTTVISKASIPLVVLPLVVLALVVTAHLLILVLSTLVLLGNGPALATLWSQVKFVQMWVAMFYALIAIALWHAPLYGWLLLVSGWARRSAFLWAVLPPLAIAVFERIAFQSAHFGGWLRYRLIGWFTQAFIPHVRGAGPIEPLAAMTPGRFLSTPGLWAGLFFAAVFLAAAVRVRRHREPI